MVATDETQPVGDLVANALGHRGRGARLFPLRRVDYARRREVVERNIFRVPAAHPEAARAQHTGNPSESWYVLRVLPSVEVGLDLRSRRHADQQEPAGIARRGGVSWEYLLALVAEQPLHLPCQSLRPGR
jgi:hypothetical protein